jgi:multidrug efflux system membrane fusion protein
VQNGQDGQFVYVVKEDRSVEARTVQTSSRVGEDMVISSGLRDGETVVTEGQLRLQPGSRVTMRQANGERSGDGGGKGGGGNGAGVGATPGSDAPGADRPAGEGFKKGSKKGEGFKRGEGFKKGEGRGKGPVKGDGPVSN